MIRFHLPRGLCSAGSQPSAMLEAPTAAEVARALADALEHHSIPYAIGGALALGFYAPPRATVDVDVNAFIPLDDLETLTIALEEAGFTPEGTREALRATAAESGQFRGRVQGIRVDVFVPAIPYYSELEGTKRRASLLGRPIWILGPEDLAVLKLMFFRRKDLADVEAILRDQRRTLDRAYIRSRLAEFVGKDDERLAALTEIERDVDATH